MVTKKKLLILGASGLTGYKAFQLATIRFEPYGTYNLRILSGKPFMKLDVSDENEIGNLFKSILPDVVLNTIALHNVDFCETHIEQAYSVNSKMVKYLVGLCNHHGVRLVQISTDFVFAGNKQSSYTEIDEPNPLSIYGKSKLEGEKHVRMCSSFGIIRSSVIYGWTPIEIENSAPVSSSGKPINFALWALSKMKMKEVLTVVNDQFASPTLADVLATIALRIADIEKNDLYHVSGLDCVSRYHFVRRIAEVMGYSVENIKAVDSRSFLQVASRPKNSCLNCEKIQNELDIRLEDLDRSLAIMRSQIEIEAPELLGN